jgi:membrane protein DedA with SNARE-associated domain/rhodanese-related sulfurtransferase
MGTTLAAMFARHAYSVLFGWVLIEQGGLPIPSIPLLLAAGTMSAAHKLHAAYLLPVTMLACFLADSTWYWMGRRWGSKVVEALCRFSLEAGTQGSLTRRGAFTLLFAKFVPGLSTMAAPIAGQAKIPFAEFVLYDMAGTLIWASSWIFAGRFFGDIAKKSNSFFELLGRSAGALVVLGIIGVLVYRLVRRRQFRNELRGLRLEPSQLIAMIDDARREGLEVPFIVDLRHPLDVLSDPFVIEGAVRIGPDDLKERRDSIPHDRDIVLYCTCPSEETSAKVAMELRRLGIRRVRPLRGGLQGWRDAGYPLENVVAI